MYRIDSAYAEFLRPKCLPAEIDDSQLEYLGFGLLVTEETWLEPGVDSAHQPLWLTTRVPDPRLH